VCGWKTFLLFCNSSKIGLISEEFMKKFFFYNSSIEIFWVFGRKRIERSWAVKAEGERAHKSCAKDSKWSKNKQRGHT
jgi:hypothetical protein